MSPYQGDIEAQGNYEQVNTGKRNQNRRRDVMIHGLNLATPFQVSIIWRLQLTKSLKSTRGSSLAQAVIWSNYDGSINVRGGGRRLNVSPAIGLDATVSRNEKYGVEIMRHAASSVSRKEKYVVG